MAPSASSHFTSLPARARRTAAAGAAALLALLAVLVLTAPTAQAATGTTKDPADAAAGWLAGRMVDGERFEQTSGGQTFADGGLTLDAVLAFSASGVAGVNAAKAMTWIAKPANLSGYIGDGGTESYAGALAKLSLTAQVRGLDPTSFGGVDLITRLRGQQAASGRISDRSAYGDFSNGFSQSLAVLALVRTPAGAPKTAVDYLAGTECPTGGFPLTLEATPCVAESDATALVVQALLAAGRTEAAQRGLGWLATQQKPDGGFGGSGPTAATNANSSGLAAQALRVGGRDKAADRAVAYLLSLQVGCAAPADRRGAIAYDAKGFDPATAPRATAQAILGLVGVGFATLDGTGTAADAPVLACAKPTSTATPTTPTATPTTPARTTTPPVPTGTPPSTSQAAAALTTAPPAAGGPLAGTGANVRPVVWLGLVLVTAGTVLLVAVRRRPASSP